MQYHTISKVMENMHICTLTNMNNIRTDPGFRNSNEAMRQRLEAELLAIQSLGTNTHPHLVRIINESKFLAHQCFKYK